MKRMNQLQEFIQYGKTFGQGVLDIIVISERNFKTFQDKPKIYTCHKALSKYHGQLLASFSCLCALSHQEGERQLKQNETKLLYLLPIRAARFSKN